MSTCIGERYAADWQGTPKRMSREDLALWKIYQASELSDAVAVYFDVTLGKGCDPGNAYTKKERDYWKKNTQLRADVIVEYQDRVRVVELRINASASTIGRTQAYAMLLRDDNPFKKLVETEVVTNIENAQVREIAERQNVIYTVLKK